MDLSVAFECLRCRKASPQPLTGLAPGQVRQCPDCAVSLELTAEALRRLEQALREQCSC